MSAFKIVYLIRHGKAQHNVNYETLILMSFLWS